MENGEWKMGVVLKKVYSFLGQFLKNVIMSEQNSSQ